MIRINLLPVREWRKKEAVRQQISVFFLALCLLLALLIGTGVTVEGRLRLQRQEVQRLEARKAQLAYVDKTINDAAKTRKSIEEKFQTIEQLQKGRTLTVRVLDDIVTALPIDRVWLNSLNLREGQLTLNGVALDNHTVALFMRRLESSSLFTSVTLINTKRTTVQGQDLMNFNLQVQVSNEPPKKGTNATPPKGAKS